MPGCEPAALPPLSLLKKISVSISAPRESEKRNKNHPKLCNTRLVVSSPFPAHFWKNPLFFVTPFVLYFCCCCCLFAVVNCTDPGHLENSIRQVQPSGPHRFSFGTTVSYQCSHGYYLLGTHVLTCQGDGTWDRALPQCLCKFFTLIPFTQGFQSCSTNLPRIFIPCSSLGAHLAESSCKKSEPRALSNPWECFWPLGPAHKRKRFEDRNLFRQRLFPSAGEAAHTEFSWLRLASAEMLWVEKRNVISETQTFIGNSMN